MKRNMLLMTAVILCMFHLASCGAIEKESKVSDDISGNEKAGDSVENEETVKGGGLYIRLEEGSDEYKTEDGTVLLTVNSAWPVVTADNEEAAGKINEYVKSFDPLGISVDSALEWAEADYETWGKDNWFGYVLDTKFSSVRTDDSVISFFILAYSDMGGAHPNAVSAGLNFNPESGERLTLADVAMNEQTAVEAINKFILEETKKDEEGMFFEGYEENIKDILTEDTWYLAEDGMHIIGNEYIISPHAAGILDFVIPYEEADFLKEEYR